MMIINYAEVEQINYINDLFRVVKGCVEPATLFWM